MFRFLKLTKDEKLDLERSKRTVNHGKRNMSKDKIVKEILKRGYTMQDIDHAVEIVQKHWKSYLARRLWRQCVWRVKLTSQRVLDAMHVNEIADLDFATEQWQEWRDKVRMLRVQKRTTFTRLKRELEESLRREKEVYDVEFKNTVNRIQKEMNEQLKILELTLHDPSWLEKPETPCPQTWYESTLDLKKTEDLRRVANFRKFVIQCRKELKESALDAKQEKQFSVRGLTAWHAQFSAEQKDYYAKELAFAEKNLRKWEKEKNGCRGLVMSIRKLIVQAQASGEAYIPIGSDDIYKIKAQWAQLPNTSSIQRLLGGKKKGAQNITQLDGDETDSELEKLDDNLLFEK